MTQIYSTLAKFLFSFCLSVFVLFLFSSAIGLRPAEAQINQLAFACSADATIYVDTDATGSDNGNSWADAYTDLQDGLSDARGNVSCGGNTVEIWVAVGVYTPGSNAGNSFELYDDVAIYGGFVGTETVRSERDWENNVTVLSGDKDGNDVRNGFGVVVTTTNQSGTNNRHVVTSSGVNSSAVLDGFFITAGAAESQPLRNVALAIPDADGGGLYNDGGSPTLSNLVFQGNSAEDEGGGMASKDGAPTMTNISFLSNKADKGGGLWLDNDSSVFTEGTFSENTADEDGGGLYSSSSTTHLDQILFVDNVAGSEGGAIYNTMSDLVLVDTTILENRGSSGGGGIFNDQSNPLLTNVSIKGNLSVAGGGMHNSSSHPTLTNVELSGNLALGGGALFNDGGNPILINVTINGNLAGSDGGGIYNTTNSNPTIINSIIWNNSVNGEILTTTATIFNDSSNALISNSILQNSGGSDSWDSALGTDQGNNLDEDPLFISEISPNSAPTTTADLQLKAASPAINAGNTLSYTSAITQDLAGNLRIVDSIIDIGAYEIGCPAALLLHVDKNASGQNTGASWADAYPSLQSALAHAANCSLVTEIWVASGVYTPGASVGDSFVLTDDLAIFGGFAATETVRTERDWETNKTVLSGDVDGDDTADANGVVISATNQVGDNSYHVVTGDGVTTTAVLDGFTITAGQADYFPTNDSNGGGVFLTNSYPRLSNLVISGNSANFGGGLGNFSSGPALTNVYWIGNSSSLGGGIYNNASTPTLLNVSLLNNSANAGGGIFNDNGNILSVTNGHLAGNSSAGLGGGFLNYLSDTTLTNVYFSQNSATTNGGGMMNKSGTVTITQSLFDQNTAGSSGGGLYGINPSATYTINQTTISNNIAETVRGGGLYIRQGATAYVTNSTISGNQAPANDGLADDAGNGGGIYVGGPIASYLTLEHVTVTNNEAAGNGGGLDINRDDIGDVITVTSSIIAGNTDTGGYPDCHAYGTSSYDLVVDSTNLFGGSAGDDCQPGASDLSLTVLGQTITDVLQPLAENYGLEAGNPLSTTVIIQTHALVQDSPAIDASNSTYLRDQRNGIRPSGSSNDIGAFETGLLLLDVSIEGPGSVSLSGANIDCSSGCSNLMVRDTVVTLTATAETGSTFTGWSEACPTREVEVCRSNVSSACTGTGDCVVTMSAAQFIIATFEQNSYTLSISTQGDGNGTITKSPDMPTYTYGTVVTLTATADDDSIFAGWSTGCPPRSAECAPTSGETCGDAEVCVVTMTTSVSLVAQFEVEAVNLNQPPDGEEVNTPKPEFDWDGAFEDPTTIISYTVIITSSDGVTFTLTTTDTNVVPDAGLPAGTYEWTVIGHKSDGSTVEAADTFEFTIAPTVVFLPYVSRETRPVCDTSIQLTEEIPRRPITSIGEIFFTESFAIPSISSGCSVYLSSSASEASSIAVDDILQIWIGDDLIFEHDFSQTGVLVEETISLPSEIVNQMTGQTITVTFSDYYAYQVSSTPIYLISE